MNAWFVGHIGGKVLVRVVRHGETIVEDAFEPTAALELARRLVVAARDLRPEPPPLRVVK